MTTCERIIQTNEELQAEFQDLHSNLDIAKAEKMLLLSECITAGLHAYLFKNRKE